MVISIRKSHLLPFVDINRCTHFLQDGTPCYASKHIKASVVQCKVYENRP
jgi:hypothetical protein